VHVVTVNDYLSLRDAVWMGQVYDLLGLSVGCITGEGSYLYDPKHSDQIQNAKIKNQNDNAKSKNEEPDQLDQERDVLGAFKVVHEFLRPCTRKEAYDADITYGTNNEFGFDYLRGNIAYVPENVAQREYHYAIVDEMDSILIDEARTPLIISAPDEESADLYRTFARLVPQLKASEDYTVDEKMRVVSITERGIDKVEKILGIDNIYTEHGIKYVHHLEQALRAQALFHLDKDYVVKNDEVTIVDEFTGRIMPGRRWSDGLHQAVEAKEGVSIQRESKTLASVTFQNYFRMYEKLSGMTGTALTSAEEFHKVYNLNVVAIPTNKPAARHDHPDKIFQTEEGKYRAVVRKIKECNEKGQPVLVGTVSIERNEYLAKMLSMEGIKHELLNAKNHEREGAIIAQAGRRGAVTIATNMAGRGVDIILGGNPPAKENAEAVRAAGGLCVIGTERHEARRIDNQLRGRAGRQGDPGDTQFFVSLDDTLMRVFGSDKIKSMMGKFGLAEDEAIENRFITKALESAQAKIEGFNFDTRKHLLEYDDVLNKQRQSIYRRRRAVLFGTPGEILAIAKELVEDDLDDMAHFCTNGDRDAWNMAELYDNLKNRFGLPTAQAGAGEEKLKFLEDLKKSDLSDEIAREEIAEYAVSVFREALAHKKTEIPEDNFAQGLKILLLQIFDTLWMGHLEIMDYMRSSVRLRAYGQHDPLVEYKNEGVRLFHELEAGVRSHISNMILKVGGEMRVAPRRTQESRPSEDGPAESRAPLAASGEPKVGRNDPCPCGAKKADGTSVKYKHCHGR
ncbi:MAG: preprotein translocase subunit SecA, partial [Candidatus Niyogibacteria bacterium]|nr:preprotein translocase subunit SecA [Candidatus Niyogibacteria bacterium]